MYDKFLSSITPKNLEVGKLLIFGYRGSKRIKKCVRFVQFEIYNYW